jgi:lipoprotein-anchoring transpeptidase ErfK/SrfK
MRRTLASWALSSFLVVAACNSQTSDPQRAESRGADAQATPTDPLAARDPAPGAAVPAEQADDQPRSVMQAQVVLDRLGFTPGVVDGKEGLSTRNALSGFQEANGLAQTGTLDASTQAALGRWDNIPATRVVTIPANYGAGSFITIPQKAADQAALPTMAYETLDEKLAERFHTTVETLWALNRLSPPPRPAENGATPVPVALIQAGQQIRVPNVGNDVVDPQTRNDRGWRDTLVSLGVASVQPKASRIVVSKSKETLKVYDEADKLIAVFTATMGSSRDPLPLGQWQIKGVAYNPPFHYNPELFWDVSDSAAKQLLPPGPNGPVGVAWIDLNKEHYGIHGTPEPQTIGRAESHGCVRLTNWDVARLAQMVSPGTKASFEA